MKKIKPTTRNILLASLVYQLIPASGCLLALLVNPEPKPLAILGIFAIAELLLITLIWNWKQIAKVEILDEREMMIRLKINSFVSKSVEYTVVALTLYYLTVTQLSGFSVLAFVGGVGILSQAFANYYFRREHMGDCDV